MLESRTPPSQFTCSGRRVVVSTCIHFETKYVLLFDHFHVKVRWIRSRALAPLWVGANPFSERNSTLVC